MKTLELNAKPVVAVAPVSIAAAGNVESAEIDTLGFNSFAVIPVMGVGDSALAVTMTEADTTGGAFTPAQDEAPTPADISIPFLATDDGTLKWGVFRTDRRKRFIKTKVSATGGISSLAGCIVLLFDSDDSNFADLVPTYLV